MASSFPADSWRKGTLVVEDDEMVSHDVIAHESQYAISSDIPQTGAVALREHFVASFPGSAADFAFDHRMATAAAGGSATPEANLTGMDISCIFQPQPNGCLQRTESGGSGCSKASLRLRRSPAVFLRRSSTRSPQCSPNSSPVPRSPIRKRSAMPS